MRDDGIVLAEKVKKADAIVIGGYTPYSSLDFAGYRFKIQDNTADVSSAAQFVIGSELPMGNLPEIPVAFYKNDEKVGDATGSAASGHPLNGVVWLAENLEKHGKFIAAGQLIITGGLTLAVDIRAADKLHAKFGNSGSVTVYGPQ